MKLPQGILGRLARHLVPPGRPPDFTIGPRDDPYMLRWWLVPRNRFLNVYLHHIRHDDEDRALHDHPWPSLSLVLRGAVGEFCRDRSADGSRYRDFLPGALVWRGPCFAHRLVLLGEPAWTLFITGPRIREWGFLCPQGWRHWREFTAPGVPGEVGRGCGEGER